MSDISRRITLWKRRKTLSFAAKGTDGDTAQHCVQYHIMFNISDYVLTVQVQLLHSTSATLPVTINYCRDGAHNVS